MSKNERLQKYQAKQQVVAKRAELRKNDNRNFLLISAAAVAVALAGQFVYFSFGPGYVEEVVAEPESSESAAPSEEIEVEPTNAPEVPSPEIAEGRTWLGSMEVAGNPLNFELDGAAAPQAVANFVSLTQDGYFENLSCHRLVTEGIFVLQCGDPNGDGTGGPGYNFGPIENAPEADLYEEGVIAMARRGGDDYSMGSQFFIVYENSTIPSDSVGGYTVFGRVTGGLDAIKEIAAKGTSDGGSDGAPAEQVLLSQVSVE